ncbi:four helix bundle protein [Pedobacter sp. Du54]
MSWDFCAKDTIGKQICRAADSISANIAEGYGRFHYKENKNFCYYSRGPY